MISNIAENSTKYEDKPVVILAYPQLAENVGMVARAMLNFSFNQLRIVSPRDENVIKNASSASAGATEVLSKAKVYSNLYDATKDLNKVYATSARKRYLNKPVIKLGDAFTTYTNINLEVQKKIGFLFGAEKSGLSNDDLDFATDIINIPTSKKFASLNLAQAVILVCYEWSKNCANNNDDSFGFKNTDNNEPSIKQNQQVADLEALNVFFEKLKDNINNSFFSKDIDDVKKHRMFRNIKNIFLRNNLTHSELKSLYRLIKTLKN